MGLARVEFGTVGIGLNVPVTVPDTAVSLLSLSFTGDSLDAVAGVLRRARAILSADLQATFADLLSGQVSKYLANFESNFPEFPVSAGERLLVACEDNGSGVIWFRTE